MSKRIWLIVLVQMILLLFGSYLDAKMPLVVAHRGASSLAPENTMAAVYAALDLGVDIIEVDVHRSADGKIVVIHDSTVNRTTEGEGPVRRMKLSELQMLDAGSWFGSAFKTERIPTLEEVLKAINDRALLLIELKGKNTEIATIELVRELGMSNQVILQSFNLQRIKIAKERAPEIPTMLLIYRPKYHLNPTKATQWMVDIAESVQASGIAVRARWCTSELLELASQRNLNVFVWTINRKVNFEKFINIGVQGIITNRPQTLLSLPQYQ